MCGGKHFQVSRFILSIRSPVFKAIFDQTTYSEAKTGIVMIEDIEPETLEVLVRFIYTDSVKEKDLTPALLSASDKYDLRDLFKKCENR